MRKARLSKELRKKTWDNIKYETRQKRQIDALMRDPKTFSAMYDANMKLLDIISEPLREEVMARSKELRQFRKNFFVS